MVAKLDLSVLDNVRGPIVVGGRKLIHTGPSPRGFHRLGLAAQCLQRFAWERRDPNPVELPHTPPLARGILIHVALAHHYAQIRAYQQGQDPTEWWDAPSAVDEVARREGIQKYAKCAKEAYAHYRAKYPPEVEAQEMEVLMVEDIAHTIIADRYLLTGRMDLVYRDLGGRIHVMDHKSSARITARHKVFYSIHGQLFAYLRMAREKYGQVATLKVNLIQHTTPKFDRFDLPRAAFLEASFEQIIIDMEERIEAMDAIGRPYDQWPKAVNELTCFSRYGVCPFIERCQRGRGAMRAGDFTVDMSEED